MFTTEQQERVEQRRVPLERLHHVVLLRGGGVRRHRRRCARPKELSINKIGHAMHDLDPVFERFTLHARAGRGRRRPRAAPTRSRCRACTSSSSRGIGGEVGCHQDATFLYTDPMTVTGFWFAIEDATLENGCLWAAPGGHRRAAAPGVQARRRLTDDDGTEFEQLDATPLPDRRLTTWCRCRCRPARWSCCTVCSRTGAAPTARRSAATPTRVHCIAAAADYPDVELAAAPGRHAAARVSDSVAAMTMTDELIRAGAEGAAARPPRRRVRPATVVELAEEYGYNEPADHRRRRARRRGSTAAPSATTSCSTSRRSPTPSA